MKNSVPLGEFLTQVRRPVKLIDDQLYTNLGVKWYAMGLFSKEPQLGKQTKATTLYQVKEGDFIYNRLFAWKGSFAVVKPEHDGLFVSGEFPTFEVSEKINRTYLMYFFSVPELWESISAKSSGTSQTSRLRLKEKDFLEIKIPFRPLPKQEQIAHLLDEAEALRTIRTRANERMEQFLPALFQEMFGKKEKGWTKVSFDEIATIDAPMVDPRKPEFLDLIHIGPENIEKETGKLLPARTAREDGLISGKYLFDETHVLYSKIRPYLKKAALPTFKGLCSADMYPIKPNTSKINREFLWATILSEEFSEYAISVSRRANMPKINRDQLFAYQLILPPLALQREFAARVEAARGVQSAQGKSAERIEALYQSMLSRAFAGEL